jgi:hypothetical protein
MELIFSSLAISLERGEGTRKKSHSAGLGVISTSQSLLSCQKSDFTLLFLFVFYDFGKKDKFELIYSSFSI